MPGGRSNNRMAANAKGVMTMSATFNFEEGKYELNFRTYAGGEVEVEMKADGKVIFAEDRMIRFCGKFTELIKEATNE